MGNQTQRKSKLGLKGLVGCSSECCHSPKPQLESHRHRELTVLVLKTVWPLGDVVRLVSAQLFSSQKLSQGLASRGKKKSGEQR